MGEQHTTSLLATIDGLRAALAQRDRELEEVRESRDQWRKDAEHYQTSLDMRTRDVSSVTTALAEKQRRLTEAEAAHAETKRKLAEQAAVLEALKEDVRHAWAFETETASGVHAAAVRAVHRQLEADTPGAAALRSRVERETAELRRALDKRSDELVSALAAQEEAEAKVETLRAALGGVVELATLWAGTVLDDAKTSELAPRIRLQDVATYARDALDATTTDTPSLLDRGWQ